MCAYNKKDGFYRRAKREGYRSRAVYKLKQIDDKFSIFKPDFTVLDLGAAPGGWSQYAVEVVGDGNVMAVDIVGMRDIEGVEQYRADVTKEREVRRIILIAGEVDVIISDMAPNISGNYSLDQARSVYLARSALQVCHWALKENGSFVVKVFQGEDFEDLLKDVKKHFKFVKCHSPKASRNTSSEMYIIGKGYLDSKQKD
ncbi:MAG: RlmE family RNA methyltransferase [Thermoplasmata archaeon]